MRAAIHDGLRGIDPLCWRCRPHGLVTPREGRLGERILPAEVIPDFRGEGERQNAGSLAGAASVHRLREEEQPCS